MGKMTIEVSDELRGRIKAEAKRVRRFSMDEAALLIEEALDAREKKGAKK